MTKIAKFIIILYAKSIIATVRNAVISLLFIIKTKISTVRKSSISLLVIAKTIILAGKKALATAERMFLQFCGLGLLFNYSDKRKIM